MPPWENRASTSKNQIRGMAGQNGGRCVATVVTLVGGFSVDLSLTLWIMSHTKNLIDGIDLIRVTNCSFFI